MKNIILNFDIFKRFLILTEFGRKMIQIREICLNCQLSLNFGRTQIGGMKCKKPPKNMYAQIHSAVFLPSHVWLYVWRTSFRKSPAEVFRNEILSACQPGKIL